MGDTLQASRNRRRAMMIAVSGQIASGKSAVAKVISNCLSIPLVSFGDYVANESLKRGAVSPTRREMQDTGLSMVQDSEAFVTGFLTWSGYDEAGLIIDGLRHKAVGEALKRQISPQRLFIVFLDSDPTIISQRLESRGLSEASIQECLTHPVESQLNELRANADLILERTVSLRGTSICDMTKEMVGN